MMFIMFDKNNWISVCKSKYIQNLICKKNAQFDTISALLQKGKERAFLSMQVL